MNELTVKQITKLIEWLRSNGFTDEKIIECINYIGK